MRILLPVFVFAVLFNNGWAYSVKQSSNDLEKLKKLLVLHEGRKHQAYRCTAGRWSIGVGHNLEAHESREEIARLRRSGATDREIEKWFEQDVANVISKLESLWGDEQWWRDLAPARKAVLYDMCYNMGPKGLLGFKRMLAAVKRGDFAGAEREMLRSKWASQVKGRATRLGRMMRTGSWPEL